MDEIGIVTKTDGAYAQVELAKGSQCKQCSMCIPSTGGQMLLLDVRNELHAQNGDKVRIALQGGNIITAALVVYGIPLAGLVCGAIAGSQLQERVYEYYSFLPVAGAVVGLCVGFVIGFIFDKAAKRSGRYKPKIIEIIR